MMQIVAKITRTKMIGGGNSYDVLIPADCKSYKPITNFCYATIINWRGQSYYRISDFLRTPKIDNMKAFSDERSAAFRKLQSIANRLEFCLAKRAFKELKTLKKLPKLWTNDNFESRDISVEFTISDRNVKRLELK